MFGTLLVLISINIMTNNATKRGLSYWFKMKIGAKNAGKKKRRLQQSRLTRIRIGRAAITGRHPRRCPRRCPPPHPLLRDAQPALVIGRQYTPERDSAPVQISGIM